MRRIPIPPVLALALLVSAAAACVPRDSRAPQPSTAQPAPAGLTAEPKAGDVAVFRPPSDGRLTTTSVERYLAVQKRASELTAGVRLESGKPPGDAVAQLATADFRAAQELGYDASEYRWVRERVREALGGPAESMNIDGVLKGLNAAALESLEARRAETEDPSERARLGEEIARIKTDLDRRSATPGPDQKPSSPSALEHNRKVIEPFQAQLSHLEAAAPDQLPKIAIATKPAAR